MRFHSSSYLPTVLVLVATLLQTIDAIPTPQEDATSAPGSIPVCTSPIVRNGNFSTPINPSTDWTGQLEPVHFDSQFNGAVLFANSTQCSDPSICTRYPEGHPVFLLEGYNRRDPDPTACSKWHGGCSPIFHYKLTQRLDFSSCTSWENQTFTFSMQAFSKQDKWVCDVLVFSGENQNGDLMVIKNFDEKAAWKEFGPKDFVPARVDEKLELNLGCSEDVLAENQTNSVAEAWILVTDVKIVPAGGE